MQESLCRGQATNINLQTRRPASTAPQEIRQAGENCLQASISAVPSPASGAHHSMNGLYAVEIYTKVMFSSCRGHPISQGSLHIANGQQQDHSFFC
jgi:hypothetical protein